MKTRCELIGHDGNIFNLIGIAAGALRKDGKSAEAKELTRRVMLSNSYDEGLGIILKYVDDVCEGEFYE